MKNPDVGTLAYDKYFSAHDNTEQLPETGIQMVELPSDFLERDPAKVERDRGIT
jgi:hypothetical protein